ncbi:MAG: glycosyltransferase family A protein, partial [Bacteroidota bacterium]
MPFFSLIIPTYNRKHRLHAPLDTALAQTFRDFELILVDDGSTDQTEKWLKENYNDPRIRYFYKENEERSIARNFGVQQATGKFIFFLDSDDELLPNHFEVLHQAIQKHSNIHRFATKFHIRTDAGNLLPSRITLPEGKYDYRILLQGNPFNSMLCLRREGVPVELFPPKFRIGEDWIFMMRNLWEYPVFIIDQTTAIS